MTNLQKDDGRVAGVLWRKYFRLGAAVYVIGKSWSGWKGAAKKWKGNNGETEWTYGAGYKGGETCG